MAVTINTNIKNDADGYLLDANAVKVRDGVMLDDELTDIAEDIDEIKVKIPTSASSTNKLVSASEMGDAISSVEAKQLYATASQGSFATKAALINATTYYNADGTVGTPTKNDVAYVLADESHSGKSAKYVIAQIVDDVITWGFVITFSDTTFTQAQMDAINSGATSENIAAIAGKQDAISDLEDIREGAGLGATALQPDDRPPIELVEELPEVPMEGTIYMVVEPV